MSRHPASLPEIELLMDCDIERTRRGGPGGQHRNKTETAIVVTHRPSRVSGQASERRSQLENRKVAIIRLRTNLALAVRCCVEFSDESATPSAAWSLRVRGGKINVSLKHADFPGLLAEALDWVFAAQFELPPVASRLRLSTSQLIKFLKSCPEAWQMVQHRRTELGMPRLK